MMIRLNHCEIEDTMSFALTRPRHAWPLCALSVVVLLCLAACTGSSATVAHSLAVTPQVSHALTFYEGEADEDPEAFTPFMVANGPKNTVISFGFALQEGAYYLASYDATWQERNISNGFQPSDPHWDCDQSPESAVVSPDVTLVARPCIDGSLTVFAESTAIEVFHRNAPAGGISLSARVPSVAFAPDSHTIALTNDGPSGPGQAIITYDTHTWAKRYTLDASAGLLSRPSWSADGTHLAAVTLDGTLHIWDAASGAEVASMTTPRFNVGTAGYDPAGPPPQWSPDGTTLYVTTPGSSGALITAWALTGNTLVPHASTIISAAPTAVNPQLAPDGAHLLVHTAAQHGQILRATDLRQVSDFALPGSLTLWLDATHLAAFTLQATVVPLQVG
jgi:hypothetical protein